MRKNVILVNSQFNIILAVQLRRAMFANEPFDLILSDETKGLKEIYEKGILNDIFDNVYFVDRSKMVGRKNKLKRALALLNPGQGLYEMIGQEIELNYTDIFFWNPDAAFYYMYMQEQKDGINYRLHIYCDAATNYYMATPDDEDSVIFQMYKPYLHNYLRNKLGARHVRELEFDHYMFDPQYCTRIGHHDLVEIPHILRNETSLKIYNSIFTVTLTGIEKYKYLFFSQPIKDYIEDTSLYEHIVCQIANKVGAENIVVKMHPRCTDVDKAIYEKAGIAMISDPSPWEIYCLNNDTDGKVYISMASGAPIMPHLLFGQDNRTIMLYKCLGVETVGNITPFYEKFGDYLDIPRSEEELMKVLDDITQNC